MRAVGRAGAVRSVSELEIRQPIVVAHAVAVMYLFVRRQRTPEDSFERESVL